jgi:hypothetical protein
MKFKFTLASASLALLMANSSWAESLAYYQIEEIVANADGALYGPFPVAMSEDAEFIATYSMKAFLSSNIDIGLPFTFNRDCQYDDILCEFEFYGSEEAGQLSYENAYQDWRNAQADASSGYSRYMFANTLLGFADESRDTVFNSDDSSDVKITDVTDFIDGERYVVGYGSAPYSNGEREFVRRAYVETASGEATELLPDFLESGGFSSAYKLQEVTYADGTQKTLVIGAASKSYPKNNIDYFDNCYNSDEDDNRYTYNDLVYCPGFDTQAWAWDIKDYVVGEPLTGFALATTWLENNENNQYSLTFSANAFDMNSSGVAVGASTFQYGTGSEGARQRAIIMTPDDSGVYASPIELTAATQGIEDQEYNLYNTWALTVSEGGIVTGNREYDTAKGRNYPTEFFVYDINTETVSFPLLNKKVATKAQYIESGSQFITKSGANSRIYDANEAGLMVGQVDDYDQTDPVYQGGPRSQTAFLYDNATNQAWLINDLLCVQDSDGEVTLPYLVRIRSARVISESGIVLAEGFKYGTENDYINKTNATQTAFKLTPNAEMASPNESPNCWESSLLDSSDEDYSRQGAATFWLWLFALPLLFIRRFKR